MQFFVLPVMQKCYPVLIKTAATAASGLISLTGSIVYSPASSWSASVLFKGSFLVSSQVKEGRRQFRSELFKMDQQDLRLEISAICVHRDVILWQGGCRKLFVLFLEQFCGVEAVVGPLSSECDSVLDLLAQQGWRCTLARRLIPFNCQWF